jgi:hypothetical protein
MPFWCGEWTTSKSCLGGSFFSYTSTRMLPRVGERAVGIGVVHGPRPKPVNILFVHQYEDVPRECPIFSVLRYKDVPLNKPFWCGEWTTSKACLGGSFFSYTSTRMLPRVGERAVGIGVVHGPRPKPVNILFVHQYEDVPRECPIFP